MTNIVIDNDLTFEYVSNNYEHLIDISGDLTIKFYKVFSKPSGIAFLSTLVNLRNSTKPQIKISFNDFDDIKYLQRADFFKNLNYNLEERFNRHSVLRNMMECKKVQNDEDPDFIDERLKAILKAHIQNKENLILGILLTTYEVTDNILEHCNGGEFKQAERSVSKPGFVCAQYYGGQKNNIEIGISDSGIGIVNSLETAYPELSREEVLKKAFEQNTSRHKEIMPSRGNGLAKLKDFVLSSNGAITCRTNEYEISFNSINPDGIISIKSPIIGTHFKIIIGCSSDIDTRSIFNASHDDYEEDDFDDFFDFSMDDLDDSILDDF
ncbi:hypothetical protein MN086_06395 [Sulfurovum sp. XGS-02]|uniref:hypothetical protein n=1 Tax=Sulfurovum sp. XGS-02 TaxID=2925411 RepID=UPI00205173F3|nr:hypothetical protein [Sulfurovum sp. XGS-02]UPT76682.1 hypothetical protein MN086_06395 [Sulfurovum sp. XGS-02]